jgi:hypothetical protein
MPRASSGSHEDSGGVIAARRQNVMKQASSARQPMKCKSRNAATKEKGPPAFETGDPAREMSETASKLIYFALSGVWEDWEWLFGSIGLLKLGDVYPFLSKDA